ncbi:serine/threonine-protein kinase [Enhygromyxa salina]|uniref:Serine/threonine-protein kinase PrkC n=1 Tax=Enhygromyxa salina TaxID=215803 RepID=A0A2S9YMM9_9BACT|nr:serine/threonine-protein kinase [Enhygromyxa salina]PRQ06331.1 Serine/threonine-protein kinase PrkC [Enhygromyxa salina]
MDTDQNATIETVDASPVTVDHRAVVPGAGVEVGAKIGRYVATSKLGAGAMGVVVGAYDPDLDRRLAIKLLKTHTRDHAAGARLEREARALAKLEHPNVVAIHDVGVHRDQVFVAMEYVEGQTLRAWMLERDQPRPCAEVLAAFRQAGEGLAAAHGVGLVHRDFKPDNVMLGRDGRVRVMDFGLARVEVESQARVETSSSDAVAFDPLDTQPEPLTRVGALVGTPVYMAPEQLEVGIADARSDQFSFCVSLYEALYGVRPFAGASIRALVEAIQGRRIEEPEDRSATRVPSWVRQVVVRGLAAAPDDRFTSMAELLAALDADPGARWRKRAVGLALVIAVGLGIRGALVPAAAPPEPCADMGAKLDGIWDDARRVEVHAAITGTGASYAEATATRVEGRLARYAGEWVEARTEACMATARGEQSEALLDLRMACLDGRADYLRAAVDVLREADAAVVLRAVEIVARLPSLARCADTDTLAAAHPLPDDDAKAAAVRALDERLAAAETIGITGAYPRALAAVDAIVFEAEILDYAPLEVRARELQGRLQARSGEHEQAAETLERAYFDALSAGMPEQAAGASTSLVRVLGSLLEERERVAQWIPHAQAVAEADGSDERRAELLNTLGIISLATDDGEAAGAYFEQSLALHRQRGADELALTPGLHNLALIAAARGDWERAEANDRQVCTIIERELGDAHPALLPCLTGLAEVAQWRGDLASARASLERGISVTRDALGPKHPRQLGPLTQLGELLVEAREPEAAIASLEQALALALARGRGPRKLGRIRFALARALVAAADADDVAIRERAWRLAVEARAGLSGEKRAAVDTWLVDALGSGVEDLEALDAEP